MSEFVAYPKIPRLNRDITITEKIDGTNAQVLIAPVVGEPGLVVDDAVARVGLYCIWAGSRSRWLQPGKQDHFGFAGWVAANAAALVELLGPGRCFGEWWGAGVQRRYGQAGKRFSLFNVSRYEEIWTDVGGVLVEPVPVLYRGPWLNPSGGWAPHDALLKLSVSGSAAAPGFMKPEGIVVFHEASGRLFKATIDGDEKPKGKEN